MDTEKGYNNVSNPIDVVMAHIEDFVIPENRRAIEYLWDMNIMTTQTNNYDNDDSWIAIGKLSEENADIFYDFANKRRKLPKEMGEIGLIGYGDGFRVPVKPGTKDPFDEFLPLFKMFKYQDVQKDGYMTIEEFYVERTNCYTWGPHPNYHPLPEPKKSDFADKFEYYRAYSIYLDSQAGPSKAKLFDPSKCVKDLEEYLKDAGLEDCYDAEEGKIFYNRRLYEGHMRYKEMMAKERGMSI